MHVLKDPYLFPPDIYEHMDPLTSAKTTVNPLISSKLCSTARLIA